MKPEIEEFTDTDEYGELISTAISDQQLAISKTYYYVYDGIGQIIGLVDETGKIVVKYTYDSWGVPKEYLENKTTGVWEEVEVGTFGNFYLYKGYYYDVETGLYYLNARYYDPTLGRFLTKDPDGGRDKERLSLNSYLYVENNPINEADPSGRLNLRSVARAATRAVRAVKQAAKTISRKIQTGQLPRPPSPPPAQPVTRAAKIASKAVEKRGRPLKVTPPPAPISIGKAIAKSSRIITSLTKIRPTSPLELAKHKKAIAQMPGFIESLTASQAAKKEQIPKLSPKTTYSWERPFYWFPHEVGTKVKHDPRESKYEKPGFVFIWGSTVWWAGIGTTPADPIQFPTGRKPVPDMEAWGYYYTGTAKVYKDSKLIKKYPVYKIIWGDDYVEIGKGRL